MFKDPEVLKPFTLGQGLSPHLKEAYLCFLGENHGRRLGELVPIFITATSCSAAKSVHDGGLVLTVSREHQHVHIIGVIPLIPPIRETSPTLAGFLHPVHETHNQEQRQDTPVT